MVFLLFSRTKTEDEIRLVWLLLGLGLMCDFLGETVWAVIELGFKIEAPYPSWADIGWVLAYPLLFLGLRRQLRLARGAEDRWVLPTVIGFGVAGVIFLFFIVLRPLVQSGTGSWLKLTLNIYYPLFSFLNFVVAVWLIVIFGHGALDESWLLICVSFFFFSIGDTAYSYLTARNLYPAIGDTLSDLSWILGYLLAGLGFYNIRVRTE